MRRETGKNMMTVLPHSFYNDEGGFRRNLAKDLDAVTLTVDEAVLLDRIVGMTPAHRSSIRTDGSHHMALQLFLCGPARLVGRNT
jgi:hypothetical protein